MSNKTSPRIYNLFPRLLGSIDNWDKHLKRVLKMEFDWVFVNPVNYSGFSGSLYSIKDYFKLNPLFALDESDEISWGSLKTFITKCHAYGLKFMIDLVFNHTAIDSQLISEHILLSLRTYQGVSLAEFEKRFEIKIFEKFDRETKELIENKMAIIQDGYFKLTKKGMLICDEILLRFTIDA